MNTIPNKPELDDAETVIETIAANAGYKVKAITASTEEYKALKAYAFGSKAEFICIDTGHEYHLMNVTGNSKSYTVDQFVKVYATINQQLSYALSKATVKSYQECLVKSKNHVRQICEEAFRS